jgi:branched-chain amino acid transport system ATP-binding protein
MSTLLEVSDLSVSYDRIEAVRGLSFAVDFGASLALLGANGAGKTSAVEAIAGLLPKSHGRVHFNGRDISRASASEIARCGLALVPQWRELFATFTVEETLQAALHTGRMRGRNSLDDIYDLFPRLRERRQQIAGTLSGGEQQMLAVGRALAIQPLMLLLDEPTAGLAVGIVKDLVAVLRQIVGRDIAIVLVEQNIEVATTLTAKCVVLAAGNTVWQGSMQEASRSEQVRHFYFGTATSEARP